MTARGNKFAPPVSMPGSDFLVGEAVVFLVDDLGASDPNDVTRLTRETFGKGDSGTVAFKHPNQRACASWFFVSCERGGSWFVVAVHPSMVERAAG